MYRHTLHAAITACLNFLYIPGRGVVLILFLNTQQGGNKKVPLCQSQSRTVVKYFRPASFDGGLVEAFVLSLLIFNFASTLAHNCYSLGANL